MMLIRIDKGSFRVTTDHREQVSGSSCYLDEQTQIISVLWKEDKQPLTFLCQISGIHFPDPKLGLIAKPL